MTISPYSADYIFFDEGSHTYFSFYLWGRRKATVEYVIAPEGIRIYRDSKATFQLLKPEHLKEFIDFCNNKQIPIKKVEEQPSDKFTIEKLLIKMGIKQMSCQYNCSQTIKNHKDREIVAYTIGPYSGLIISKKLNENEGYFASRFYITYLKQGQATFTGMDLGEAISELRRFKKEGYKVKMSKKTEEKLQSAIFMKNI